VAWRSPGPGATATRGEKALPPATLGKLGGDWLHAGPEVWSGIDVAWMASLAQYDLWDFDRNDLPATPQLDPDSEPVGADLWAWAELRIARGVHDGAATQALAEVRELARLSFTTERRGTQIAGLMLLSLVMDARDRLGITVPMPETDAGTIRRMLRATTGAFALVRLWTPASYEADFTGVRVGRCTALHDGLWTALQVRPLLRDELGPEYQRLDRLLAAAPDCRLGTLRSRWARPDEPQSSEPDDWRDVVLQRIAGHLEGKIVLGRSEQDWLGGYEERGRTRE
jgi:hypothetical protein